MIDVGLNLTSKQFLKDRDAVVERAIAAGVTHMVLTGTSLASSEEAAALAAVRESLLSATAGVHPHGAKDCDASTLAAVRQLASRPEVVAVGECGLDFDRDFSPRPDQERVFAAQLELAAELKMPVFLHERAAHERFMAILREHAPGLPGFVVHCFTGTGDELDAYLELGAHIGITGWICDERRGTALRAMVGRIPIERLMLETDAPYLLPRDLPNKPKKRRNEPAFLPHICEAVARHRGDPADEVAAGTTKTARAFFRLPARLGADESPSGRNPGGHP